MVGDAILIVLFGLWYFFELVNMGDSYYSSGILVAYASITAACYV
jgi:hypothetical protein